jgi:ATP/maltotriose-dependent transcriptional regulator MalT
LVFEGLLELDHAHLLEQRGASARAEALLSNMDELLRDQPVRLTPLHGRIALLRGRLALNQGQDERAAPLFQSGLNDCLRSHDKRVLYGYLGQAQLAANQRDFALAFNRLRAAERLMQQRQIPDTVYRGVLLQVSSHFWLQQARQDLACEALSRVLRHYQGAQAVQAPPATVLLIPRIEYLLILAHAAHSPMEAEHLLRLQHMLSLAQSSAMNALQTELQLVIAELLWLTGRRDEAANALQHGLQLATDFHCHHAVQELNLRRADMLQMLSVSSDNQQRLDTSANLPLLSQRELKVLKLIALGYSNQQIADEMFISLHTVKTHARRINVKLCVERRTQAVAKAKSLGLLS